MEFDILDALDDLGDSISSLNVKENKQRCTLPVEDSFACLRYSGVLKNDEEIKDAIEKGTKSIEFTQLVEWLSKELQSLNDMESCVNALTDLEDSSSFLLEVSSFLKELHCPYTSLMNGPISQRLIDVVNRRALLDFLCTELLTARLLYSKKKVKNLMEIEVDTSSTALSLENALKALSINVDEVGSDSVACLAEIENKVKKALDSKSVDIPPPIISETLSNEQWESLNSLYEDFLSDYTVRRKMLLTRLEVTVQSFKWGEGSKGKENKILNGYLPLRKKLKDTPSVMLSDVIAARESLLVDEKTTSVSFANKNKSLYGVLIAAVPDRGGRPKEQRPPVEMPNWSKRSQGGGGGRGDHRGGGRGNWRGKGKKFRGNQGGGGGGDKGNKRAGHFHDDYSGRGKKFKGHKGGKRRH